MRTLRSLLQLSPYLKPFIGIIIASALLGIPLSLLRTSPVPLVKYLVDELLVSKDQAKLLLLPALVIAVYLVNLVVRFLHYFLLRIVVARVHQRLKNDLYRHLMGLSSDFFTNQRTGTLISRVGSDPQYIDGGLACINVLVREPLTFIFLFCSALYLNWELTLITLIIFPLLVWIFSFTGKALKRYITRMTEENALLFSRMQETFSGIRTIKTFRLEKYVQKKFRGRIERFTKHSLKTAAVQEASHPMVELLTAFAIAGVIYYGGNQVLSNKMTSGELLAFFAAFALMMDPIRRLNDVNIKLNQAAAAADRIFEILSWKPTLRESENPLPIRNFEKEIRFENVSFAYPDEPEREVLKNISFTLPKDTALALVGASGSGKSSTASLLPRIFDVTSGKILLDGQDIRRYRVKDLRRQIAVVSQDVFLFNDTIAENIRCGRLSATRDEIEEAAKHAHALDFINDLPDGFDTLIGDRGQKLSGGERQRLSIARAFLSNSPILILDEATSSLDSASERIVQKAIETLMENRTTLVIAHRLSTIRNADQILVLKDGEIVESGRHQELMGSGGEYARFQRIAGVQS